MENCHEELRGWCAGLALASVLALEASARIRRDPDPKLAHMVFFGLKDHSKEARDKLIAACEKYLSGHEGCVSFSVGTGRKMWMNR